MQYFQAVQQGRQRAAKSQMKLFDIAGFAGPEYKRDCRPCS